VKTLIAAVGSGGEFVERVLVWQLAN